MDETNPHIHRDVPGERLDTRGKTLILMITEMLPPLFLPLLHNGAFTWDELLCTVLVAVVLVVGALVALRFEKEVKEEVIPSEPDKSSKE